jgi:hypothetical protein
MRFSHLINLVSFAGVVSTSPTPAQPGGREASTGPRRLVVYAEDQFQGPFYEIDAFYRCIKLEPPVYKNLHSYGVVDQVCHFLDDDNCNSNGVFDVDARGTEVWGRIDVGGVGGRAGRVRSVLCEYLQVANTPQANTASTKRDGHTHLSAITGPGETIVCENTLESGRCETLSANSACVPIPAGLAHNIRSIYQAAGSICKYYDGTCDVSTPVLSLNSHREPKFLPLDRSVGDRISLVKCQDQWLVAEIENGSASVKARADAKASESLQFNNEDNHVRTEGRSVRNVKQDTAESCGATPCDDPRYIKPDYSTSSGNLYFCGGHGFGSDPSANCHRSCVGPNAQNNCWAMDVSEVALVDYVFQFKGTICKYFQKDCSDTWPVLIIDSRSRDIPPYRFKEQNIYVSQVLCSSNWATADLAIGSDTIVYNGTTSTISLPGKTKANYLASRDGTDASMQFIKEEVPTSIDDYAPGDVSLCSMPVFTGICDAINAMDRCVSLPLTSTWQNVHSIIQSKGAVCGYFSGEHGCDNVHMIIDSRKGTGSVGSLDDSVKITRVHCIMPQSSEGHQDIISLLSRAMALETRNDSNSVAPTQSANEVAPPLTVADDLPGSITVCSEEMFQGSCQTFNAIDLCVALPQDSTWRHVRSIVQAAGAICRYYEDQHDCADVREKHDTTMNGHSNGRVVPDPVGITRVRCELSLGNDGQDDGILAPSIIPETPRDTATSSLLTTRDVRWKEPDPRSTAPLLVCHDVNMGGKCFDYVITSDNNGFCVNNPFNVDAIQSFRLRKGWRCAFYPASDCQSAGGPPQYINSKNDKVQVNDAMYGIRSVACMPTPY